MEKHRCNAVILSSSTRQEERDSGGPERHVKNRAGVRLERKEPWTSVDTEGHALQRGEAQDDAPTNQRSTGTQFKAWEETCSQEKNGVLRRMMT